MSNRRIAGGDDLRAMLEARADRVGASDEREVRDAVGVVVRGAGKAAAAPGGVAFGVRPVRVRRRPLRAPWRLAAVGLAAVAVIALAGSRLDLLRQAPRVPAASPSESLRASTPPGVADAPSSVAVLSPAALKAGVEDGSLEGRTVVAAGRLDLQPLPCPSPMPPDCYGLRLGGADGVDLAHSDLDVGTARTRTGGEVVIAVRVGSGRVSLLGWVVDGRAAPLRVEQLAPGGRVFEPGGLGIVEGWLTPGRDDGVCTYGGAGCEGTWPRLSADAAAGPRGVDVSVDPSIPLGNPSAGAIRGTFLVASLEPGRPVPPAFRVVGRLEPSVSPVARPAQVAMTRMTLEELGREFAAGSLDGKLVVVDGRLHLAYGRCLGGAAGTCTFVQLAGLEGVFIDKGDLTVDETSAGIARHPVDSPLALLVKESRVSLVGWLVDGTPDPIGVASLMPGDRAFPPGDLAVVRGWVIGPGATMACPATRPAGTCPGGLPWLTDTAPLPDGTALRGMVGLPVNVVSTLGLRDTPDEIEGPFLVRRAGPAGGAAASYEIAGVFTDVVRVALSATPVSSASPPGDKPSASSPAGS